MTSNALSNPTVLLTLAAIGAMAVALTLAVVRSLQAPQKRAAFSDALDVIYSSELDIDTALNKDDEEKKSWSDYWLRLVRNSGRVVLNDATPGRFAVGLGLFGALFGVLVFPGGMIGLVLLPIVLVAALRFFLQGEAKKRIVAMEGQLPQLLSAMRANLQAGSTPVQALLAVADELPAPLGDEMRMLKRDLNVNMEFNTALAGLAERVASRDMKFLVASIQIAIRGGADLEPQLAVIEEIVAQRTRIRGKLRSAVAQVKPTQMLAMGAVPLMFFVSTRTPENAKFWFGNGLIYLILAGALYGAGAYLIRFMIKGVENS